MQIPIIYPDSRFKIFWEVYILLVTVAVTIVAPLILVFNLMMTPFFITSDILVTITFAADIFIHFNTAYGSRLELITDRKAIAKHYLKGWFFLDLIATLPFSWIFISSRFSRLNSVFRYFRLARLFKLFGSSKTLNRARKLSFVNPAFMRLFMLVFWILVAGHLVACGWIFIGGVGEYTTDSDYTSNGAIYLEAFYWTVTTLTTIGYGDITPSTPGQFIYVIFIMLLGAAIYGFIIGNIANIIANIDVAKSQFREKIENIDTFLKYRDIPGDLQKRIHDYYDYLWDSRRGYEESKLLRDLPTSLKTQVAFFLNREIIEKVPIFKNASREFVRDIILNLKPVIYTPGDAVVTFGEIGYEMYFISRGEVDVTNEEGTITYATLTSGQFFGEIALLLSTPRTATVKARGYCDLYVLDKDTFDSILQRYPRFAKNVEELSDERRKELGLEKEEDKYIEIVEDGSNEASGPVPDAPEPPMHQLLEDGVVRISWLPMNGADSYEIIRRCTGEDKWKRLSSAVRNPVYLDLHTPTGEVTYRIRGINRHGNGKWSPTLTIRIA
ncbi:MAG: Crp/Fnr family transcriptional regulator [Spirochaetes bacterium]|nr:MAG: Crp/Fnr family transcriptional regulator [Spirochaetota bacterium]